MLFQFFFFLLNFSISSKSFKASLLNDDSNSNQKYTISRVSPSELPSTGGISIEVHINPPFNGPCYVKFDTIIVKGNGDSNGVVICEVPKHRTGSFLIYFSTDSETWSDGYLISYIMESQTLLIVILIIGGTCFASIVMFWWQVRQCKNSSRRNRDTLNPYDNRLDYEDGDDLQPLKRKTNRDVL